MFETPHLTIELNGREIIYLCDAIKNGAIAEGVGERDTFIPVAREALLLLAGPFLEVCQGDYDKIIPVNVTEEFCWLARNVVSFGSMGVDKQPLGHKLLAKVYKLLLEFKFDFSLEEIYAAGSANQDTYESTIYLAPGGTGVADGPRQNLPGSERSGSQGTEPVPSLEDDNFYEN